MRFLRPLTAIFLVASTTAQQAYLGFNSGATLPNRKAKQQSDYEQEFKTAQALVGSPGVFNSVRLYTNVQARTDDTPISAFQAAINTNTSMLLGIWCSGTTSINKELSALKKAIAQYGQQFADLVVGISVGSEDLYRISESGIKNKAGVGQPPEEMLKFIKSVRDAIADTSLSSKPVGHVDTWSAWSNSSNAAVIEAVDFLGTDLYAYYEDDKGNDISNATTLFDNAFNATLAAAGQKPVWITETGWPTTGPKFGAAEATTANAKAYWDAVGCKLFGKTNTWWYTLRDSNPDNEAKFAITKDLSTTPIFNLSCPSTSGAPTPVNNNGGSSSSGGSSGSGTQNGGNSVRGASMMGSVAVAALLSLAFWLV